MPELPEVETVPTDARACNARLSLPSRNPQSPQSPYSISRKFVERLRGETVDAVDRRGKYLIVRLSSGETLIMHLGMSGWFHVAPTGDRSREVDAHDHVIFVMSSGQTVVFNDPRRFRLHGSGRARSLR